MKTADLTGALLDYWVARAEGIDAKDLAIKDSACVRQHHDAARQGGFARTMNYSTNWALTGPLVEKGFCPLLLEDRHYGKGIYWTAHECDPKDPPLVFECCPGQEEASGPTAMIAVCRAVVRAAFGDEVEDLEVVS